VPPTVPPGDAPETAPRSDGELDRRPGDDAPERSVGRTILVAAGLAFVAATFGVWLYALFIYDPGLMIDELADTTFPEAAEVICHRARVDIEALPTAEQTPTADERADVVDEANDALRRMHEQLGTAVPTEESRINDGIRQWVEDWGTFIADREDYAADLRNDPDRRFTESLKSNRQISRAIDAFAQVNRMPSCTVPGDVG